MSASPDRLLLSAIGGLEPRLVDARVTRRDLNQDARVDVVTIDDAGIDVFSNRTP